MPPVQGLQFTGVKCSFSHWYLR